jgi:hypothetical protein
MSLSISRIAGLSSLLAALVGSACTDSPSPAAPRPGMRTDASLTSVSSPEHTGRARRVTASVAWNALAVTTVRARAVDPVAANRPSANAQIRTFAYLGLAQYSAVVAAGRANPERGAGRATHPSSQGAVAAASTAILSFLLPLDALRFEQELAAQGAAANAAEAMHRDWAAGVAIGRAVGADVVERARTDGFTAPFTGTIPVGPGFWRSSNVPPTPPLLPMMGHMRTFFLSSGSVLRPPAPPAYGSAEFASALAEVKQYSDTRTPEQTATAVKWAPPSLSSFFNEMLSEMVVRYRLNERRSAHAFALSFMSALDALIACHDAKYTYWFVRPTQADPTITLAVALPNHPSYPSNHACIDGALDTVMSDLFPADQPRIHAEMVEGAMSRIYGGLHYRFDSEVGLAMGNAVGAIAIAADPNGHRGFALKP